MTQTKLESKPKTLKQQNTGLSVIQSTIAGIAAGAGEVGLNHPLWTIKTLMQKGEPITLNPRILYRGILPNAASMIPITAIQVGLNRFFQQRFFSSNHELTTTQRVITAFTAGAASSLVSCPTEMIMTHQKTSFYATGAQLVRQNGYSRLYTGLLATMLREGMFTTFFLGVTPVLKERIRVHCPHDFAASIFAGMLAGIGATLASQGVDTVKTLQQSASAAESAGLVTTMQKLYSSKGVSGFFTGVIPRGTRVMSAVTVMGLITEQMKKLFTDRDETNTPSIRPER